MGEVGNSRQFFDPFEAGRVVSAQEAREFFGEEVKAVVQPVNMPANPTEAAALSAELISYCRESLADVKCPRSVDFREELPRHPTGKLYKRLLKDEYWQDAGRSI